MYHHDYSYLDEEEDARYDARVYAADFDEPKAECQHCQGTGEGSYDGAACPMCKGKGEC